MSEGGYVECHKGGTGEAFYFILTKLQYHDSNKRQRPCYKGESVYSMAVDNDDRRFIVSMIIEGKTIKDVGDFFRSRCIQNFLQHLNGWCSTRQAISYTVQNHLPFVVIRLGARNA